MTRNHNGIVVSAKARETYDKKWTATADFTLPESHTYWTCTQDSAKSHTTEDEALNAVIALACGMIDRSSGLASKN